VWYETYALTGYIDLSRGSEHILLKPPK
jgi:hypothetical protein